jgi:hypothetical protein
MEFVTFQDFYFSYKYDTCDELGFFPFQKCTITIRMLAYGLVANALDEYCKLGESIIIKSLKGFSESFMKHLNLRLLQ